MLSYLIIFDIVINASQYIILDLLNSEYFITCIINIIIQYTQIIYCLLK